MDARERISLIRHPLSIIWVAFSWDVPKCAASLAASFDGGVKNIGFGVRFLRGRDAAASDCQSFGVGAVSRLPQGRCTSAPHPLTLGSVGATFRGR